MNARDELHTLIDRLDPRDAKSRLHALVAELDEETARQIMVHVEKVRCHRLEPWRFHI
jgi:hypothetical protein